MCGTVTQIPVVTLFWSEYCMQEGDTTFGQFTQMSPGCDPCRHSSLPRETQYLYESAGPVLITSPVAALLESRSICVPQNASVGILSRLRFVLPDKLSPSLVLVESLYSWPVTGVNAPDVSGSGV